MLLRQYMEAAAETTSRRRVALGKRIREARLAKRWKQRQLAAAVHVDTMTVSRWERGQHSPDIDMLDLIAEATGKQLSFFVEEEPVAQAADLEVIARDVREIRAALLDEPADGGTAFPDVWRRLTKQPPLESDAERERWDALARRLDEQAESLRTISSEVREVLKRLG